MLNTLKGLTDIATVKNSNSRVRFAILALITLFVTAVVSVVVAMICSTVVFLGALSIAIKIIPSFN